MPLSPEYTFVLPGKAGTHCPSQVTAHSLPFQQLQPDVDVKLPAVLDVFMASQRVFAERMQTSF